MYASFYTESAAAMAANILFNAKHLSNDAMQKALDDLVNALPEEVARRVNDLKFHVVCHSPKNRTPQNLLNTWFFQSINRGFYQYAQWGQAKEFMKKAECFFPTDFTDLEKKSLEEWFAKSFTVLLPNQGDRERYNPIDLSDKRLFNRGITELTKAVEKKRESGLDLATLEGILLRWQQLQEKTKGLSQCGYEALCNCLRHIPHVENWREKIRTDLPDELREIAAWYFDGKHKTPHPPSVVSFHPDMAIGPALSLLCLDRQLSSNAKRAAIFHLKALLPPDISEQITEEVVEEYIDCFKKDPMLCMLNETRLLKTKLFTLLTSSEKASAPYEGVFETLCHEIQRRFYTNPHWDKDKRFFLTWNKTIKHIISTWLRTALPALVPKERLRELQPIEGDATGYSIFKYLTRNLVLIPIQKGELSQEEFETVLTLWAEIYEGTHTLSSGEYELLTLCLMPSLSTPLWREKALATMPDQLRNLFKTPDKVA